MLPVVDTTISSSGVRGPRQDGGYGYDQSYGLSHAVSKSVVLLLRNVFVAESLVEIYEAFVNKILKKKKPFARVSKPTWSHLNDHHSSTTNLSFLSKRLP